MSSAPTRDERKRCWDARDAYFGCLDRASVIVPGQEGKSCDTENKRYEKNCAASWVAYFNKQRVIAERQRRTLEAAEKQQLESRQK